jgi:hypothetical protein
MCIKLFLVISKKSAKFMKYFKWLRFNKKQLSGLSKITVIDTEEMKSWTLCCLYFQTLQVRVPKLATYIHADV